MPATGALSVLVKLKYGSCQSLAKRQHSIRWFGTSFPDVSTVTSDTGKKYKFVVATCISNDAWNSMTSRYASCLHTILVYDRSFINIFFSLTLANGWSPGRWSIEVPIQSPEVPSESCLFRMSVTDKPPCFPAQLHWRKVSLKESAPGRAVQERLRRRFTNRRHHHHRRQNDNNTDISSHI